MKDAIIANESDDLSEIKLWSRSESGGLNLTGRKSFWLEVGLVEISGSRVGALPDFRFLISDCQLALSPAPIENRQLAIGNRQSAIVRPTHYPRGGYCLHGTVA
jgi:hypothetical protein